MRRFHRSLVPLGEWGNMDRHSDWAAAAEDRAIRFTGSWREYLPIAATSALLIICTLRLVKRS